MLDTVPIPHPPRGGVLVAEDDDELREALVWLLHVDGFWACGVKDGTQLFEWTEPIILGESHQWIPDLIVTDLRMPGIPPIHVLGALRYVGCDVPVVVVSGLRDRRLEEMARDLGCRWLSKPLDPQEIEDVVRTALVDPR